MGECFFWYRPTRVVPDQRPLNSRCCCFDRVPREVISWAMRKLGVEEWLVGLSAVMSMYSGAKTVVRTVYGNSKSFEVKVGMHQGSALSPLLFVIVMEAISCLAVGIAVAMRMTWQ